MRWNNIITEGALTNQYRSMYQSLPVTDQKGINAFISELEKALQRQDRIVWAIQWHRIWYASKLIEQAGDPELISKRNINKLLAATGTNVGYDDAVNNGMFIANNIPEFQHYLSLPIVEIKNYVWGKQTPEQLLNSLSDIEDTWKENIQDRGLELRGDETIIEKFSDGYTWFNLNRQQCDREAKAMGHCGNGGTPKYGDTVLSLRKHIHDDYWEPALTFILDRNGYLGEMKGRGNDKPTEAYHKYIIKLLLNPIVKGMKGGGYMPENNFSMEDLPDAIQEKLETTKPCLMPIWKLYKLWKETPAKYDDMFKEALPAYLDAYDGYVDIDYDTDTIILQKQPLRNAGWSGNLIGETEAVLEEDYLAKILADNGAPYEDAIIVSEKANNDYYTPAMQVAVQYNYFFELSCVYAELSDNDTILFKSHIGDLLYTDDEQLESIEDFCAENEYVDYDDMGFSDQNEIIDAIVSLALKRASRKSKSYTVDEDHLAKLIMDEYEIEMNFDSDGSRTTNDPRQMKFDFDN